MRAMREGVARQSVEKPPRNAQMGGGRAEKPRETRESTVGRRGRAEKPRETTQMGGEGGKTPRNARKHGGAARQGGKATRNARRGVGGSAEKPRETRESTARRGGKAPRDTRKHGGCGKAPRNARMGGMAARKSPLRGARMGGVAVRGKYPAKPREWAAGGKAPAKRAGGRRSAESPSAKRANGWKKPPPAKCAEEGERMCVYAFSDAARSCASGSLRLLTALQACMTRATAMTP